MDYQTLYREMRPQSFQEVIGQEHICRTLKNAVKQGRISHAYLFWGPRGTGKTSTARILAKAINCSHLVDGEPCNRCAACLQITQGSSFDVVELDAASNRGIDDIRDLKQKAGLVPTQGHYKVYIIDEVHMLTGEAFNAFLKLLEEPPSHTIFILATTEIRKIPPTVLSRCQSFDFRRLGKADIGAQLEKAAKKKDWEIEPVAVELLSRHAGGSLRDALGLLDQAASFAGRNIAQQDVALLLGVPPEEFLETVFAAVIKGDLHAVCQVLQKILERGSDPRNFLFQLTDWARDRLFQEGLPVNNRFALIKFLKTLACLDAEMKISSRPDLVLELALARLAVSFSKEDGVPEEVFDEPILGLPQKPKAFDVLAGKSKRTSAPVLPKKPETGASTAKIKGNNKNAANSKLQKPEGGIPVVENMRSLDNLEDSASFSQAKELRNNSVEPKNTVPAVSYAQGEKDLLEIKVLLAPFLKKHPLLAQLLTDCELCAKSGKIVVTASPMAYEMLQKKENKLLFREALQEAGYNLEISFALQTDRKEQQSGNEDLVAAALLLLKGEIVSQEKKEGES